jgi:SAM-dependent methyltransferase
MKAKTNDEFEIEAFAKYYDELSDSFIDIRKASDSLKSQIDEESQIFEIGLGTGYFAKHFHYYGYSICGIQPKDEMLPRLKEAHPTLGIKAEKKLEDYDFGSDEYDVIVSHSSVFLFTKLESVSLASGETEGVFVFQSFLKEKSQVINNIEKVLKALRPNGKFFINVQTNPPRRVEVGPDDDRFVFEMVKCVYHFDLEKVEKVFRTTHRGYPNIMEEVHCALRYGDFKPLVEKMGGKVTISDDLEWVILERVHEN